uniref:Uncharacterized protein n=1 Tax=Phocoena sinus TaxID=42100 RepID=A0A8C9B8I9_PHOSS
NIVVDRILRWSPRFLVHSVHALYGFVVECAKGGSSVAEVRAGLHSPHPRLPRWNSVLSTSRRSCSGTWRWSTWKWRTQLPRCMSSFRVLVVSAKFKGKPLLQRYWLVNTSLAEELLHIHAFEQKTLTPQQWAREQQK